MIYDVDLSDDHLHFFVSLQTAISPSIILAKVAPVVSEGYCQ